METFAYDAPAEIYSSAGYGRPRKKLRLYLVARAMENSEC